MARRSKNKRKTREAFFSIEQVRVVYIWKPTRSFKQKGRVLLWQNEKETTHTPEKKRHRAPLRYRWLIFSILTTEYALVHFPRVASAVVAHELTKSFASKGRPLGALALAFFYPYALRQLPSGLLSDSLGPKRTVTGFALITSWIETRFSSLSLSQRV